jgi:hypothetical protein
MLAPLTGLVSPLVTYKWGEEQQKVFDEIKQKVSKETLLTFTDFERKRISCLYRCNKQAVGSSIYAGRKTAGFL